MSGSTPWWFSGEPPERPRIDLAGLASGAQQLVDLARQALIAPHATHEDPTAHPDCIICRAMAVMGDVRMPSTPAREIDWIELDPPVDRGP